MRGSRKRALLLLPVLLAGAHFLYWRMAVGWLEDGLAHWRAQQQRAGWAVETGTPKRGGYPFAATLSVPAVRLSGEGREPATKLAWRAERVMLRVSLARPWLLDIEPEGAQQLRVADGPDVPFRAGQARLAFPLNPYAAQWGELTLSRLRADTQADGELSIGAIRIHADLRPAAPSGQPAVVFNIRAQAIHLPEKLGWALGPDVARLELDGTLGGPLPRAGTPRRAASEWRDGGGTLEIGTLGLQWGKLAVSATASLTLDGQLQPMGTATARLTGQNETLDALAASGVLPRRTAEMAKTMITLFAPRAPAADGDGAVEIPLSLNERRLFSRQLPLARLPVLAWPAR